MPELDASTADLRERLAHLLGRGIRNEITSAPIDVADGCEQVCDMLRVALCVPQRFVLRCTDVLADRQEYSNWRRRMCGRRRERCKCEQPRGQREAANLHGLRNHTVN